MTEPAAKPGPAAPSPDPFASAKANLRDTIKWLATTFAAVAGVVLAGSTFSGLGALPAGPRLLVAIVGALLGFIFTLWGIARILGLLKSEAYFLGDLERDDAMRQWVNAHAEDLLPAEFANVESFLTARRTARREVLDPALRQQAVQRYREIDRASARITSLLHFQVMANRLGAEAKALLTIAGFAILGLATFAWAVSPPKPAANPCTCCVTAAPPKSG